ncbi:putative vacuolar proton-ATPase-like protein [Trypanosoma rangeli]|uniref:V-type proton ATPase subunit a n=1 Tax=Trypanosoma rangeli TaxID=5698 RepID=A0A3R7KUW1_TRYRA|nr:putative vacuolar proton-ATPase-like protein [Trypanosoma rangeli]RNF01847.1 putative vacuolar proton-ATPase-like protein [Trypanosoma rangeli]|eukprot:RNF01847.1 putative vacuolar proton-ATPase-like protein [Trypanosoma rangeli]
MPREGASGLWRSEDMIRLDIVTQREVLYDTVVSIGLLGKAQFVDVNGSETAFMRPYTTEIRRCDELERKLSIIKAELEREMDVNEQELPALGSPDDVRRLLCGTVIEDEEAVDALLEELKVVNASLQGLRREMNLRMELSLLHTQMQNFLPSPLSQPSDAFLQTPHVLGMVDATREEVIYAMTYRATKGNTLIELDNEHVMLLDPLTGERCIAKTPFAVFTSSPAVQKRVERLILSLGATIYSLREVSQTTREEHEREMKELQHMYEQMQLRKVELLQKHIRVHSTFLQVVQMKKKIFTIMNLCIVCGSTCTASAWIPRKHAEALRTAIREAVHTAAGNVASVVLTHPSQSNPPTCFETNKFTCGFQSLVDSYGTARYKEVNPGVFTIVTFPYLFGIMYGDIGHGMLLFFFALYLVLKENSWNGCHLNEMFAMLFGGRYLLLLMGLFSIYMGALYNDFFGFSIGPFSSAYIWPPIDEQNGTVHPLGMNNRTGVYPVGLDVAWTETENKLEFYNSVKMKCAVIVGVVQMLVGNIISLLNYIYNRDLSKALFLFIPKVVFLLSTFGYMSLAIVMKWCTSWENTSEAPSILEMMTNFFLQPGTVTQPLYRGQTLVQVILLLTAFAMVPVMLIMMPFLEACKHIGVSREYCTFSDHISSAINMSNSFMNEEQTAAVSIEHRSGLSPGGLEAEWRDHSDVVSDNGRFEEASAEHAQHGIGDAHAAATDHTAGDMETEHPFNLSEVIIHYMIDTIEYVLGCVSNTASYLRLWALSLAHAQLSEVFFTFAVVKVLNVDTTGVFIAAGVAVWLGVTLAVLVGMEALSAFLHALRLHWVEFNNKFYIGDGLAYEPFGLAAQAE